MWTYDTRNLVHNATKPSLRPIRYRYDIRGLLTQISSTGSGEQPRPDGSYDLLKAVSMEPGGDWSAAGRLSPGDRVASVSGRTLEVVASEVDLSPARVYNLEVAGDHTYAVGELQTWVHNKSGKPPRKKPRRYGLPGGGGGGSGGGGSGGGCDDHCDEWFMKDMKFCAKLGYQERCVDAAWARYFACRKGDPIPPWPWRRK